MSLDRVSRDVARWRHDEAMQRWANRRWLTAAVGVGASVIFAAVVWLTVTVARGELGTSDQLASVVSAYIGICGLVVPVVGMVMAARQNRDEAPSADCSDPAQRASPLSLPAVHTSSEDRGARADKASEVPTAAAVVSPQKGRMLGCC
jgi:hypothetical protein